ncbi:hypothetical protein C8R42DRAFT_648633 [Lentinula raphanica]|nr:hypothetical protein C8R42DRAFT_648633 [Lentinula raphanica]
MRLNPVQVILCLVFTVRALPVGELPSLPLQKAPVPNPLQDGQFSSLQPNAAYVQSNQPQLGQIGELSSLAALLPNTQDQVSHGSRLTDWGMAKLSSAGKLRDQLPKRPAPDVTPAVLESPNGVIYYQLFSRDEISKVTEEKERKALLPRESDKECDKSKMTGNIHKVLSPYGRTFVEMPVQDCKGLKDDAFEIQVDSKFVVREDVTCPCQVHVRRKGAVFVPYEQGNKNRVHSLMF